MKRTKEKQTMVREEVKNKPEETDTTCNHTVILLGNKSLIGSAIELLLSPRETWKIVRMPKNRNYKMLIQKIEEVNPGAVIAFQHERTSDAQTLMRLLQDCPKLKIITISLENNCIQIYNKQRIWIKDATDLLSAVEIGL